MLRLFIDAFYKFTAHIATAYYSFVARQRLVVRGARVGKNLKVRGALN